MTLTILMSCRSLCGGLGMKHVACEQHYLPKPVFRDKALFRKSQYLRDERLVSALEFGDYRSLF